MKKLLAIFAAIAISATLAIGLAACGDGGTNGDKSVTTQEEWDKALEDSFAATNFTFKYRRIDKRSDNYIEHDETATYYYDLDNLKFGLEVEISEGDNEHWSSKNYNEIVNNQLYSYDGEIDFIHSEDKWRAFISDYNPEDIEDFKENYNGFKIINDTELQFDFKDYTYDEETHTFKTKLGADNYYENADVTVSFRNGKLYRIYFEFEGNMYDYSTVEITVTDYGKTKVNIPKEAKDALNN